MHLNKLKKIPWKQDEYEKQNWGNNFHSISSYVGRIKPAFAYWLIKYLTKETDLILDPFCGIGTVPIEAALNNRKSIGLDLNPYAINISKSKIDIRGLKNELIYLDNIDLNSSQDIDLRDCPDWVIEYYHRDTLKEILYLIKKFKKDKRNFLFGCLLGICHGHRPQHLSIRTGYIIPYIPKPKPDVIYKNSTIKLKEKVMRMYKDPPIYKYLPKIKLCDARYTNLPDKSIDAIISSPPYYDTLDYVSANKLRLFFSNINLEEQNNLKSKLIQDKNNYLSEMLLIGKEMRRLIKNKGILIFVLGDVHYGKKTINTALEISNLYKNENLFSTIDIIDDYIPPAKTTIVKYGGNNAITSKKEKLDRILIMKKI